MGFSQKQVARMLGRSIAIISHYEHSRGLPPLAVALGLEIIYRTPVAFLFPHMYDELKERLRREEESLGGKRQQLLL